MIPEMIPLQKTPEWMIFLKNKRKISKIFNK